MQWPDIKKLLTACLPPSENEFSLALHHNVLLRMVGQNCVGKSVSASLFFLLLLYHIIIIILKNSFYKKYTKRVSKTQEKIFSSVEVSRTLLLKQVR